MDNVITVLKLFINELKIPITSKSIENEIFTHPESKSLLAISEILDNWNIPNAAYTINYEELVQADINSPIIAHTNYNNGEFLVIHAITEGHVIVSNERWKRRKIKSAEFKKLFTDAILIAEKGSESGETDYQQKRRTELLNNLRIPVVITGLIFIASFIITLNLDRNTSALWELVSLGCIKTLGLLTTVLLLIHGLSLKNPLINRICGLNPEKNCNKILSSKGAKIANAISWSEVGFFYYVGTWLVWVLCNQNSNLLYALEVLNFLALPFAIYSIFYQWRTGQWCILCCIVQALLWVEFIVFRIFLKPSFVAFGLTETIQILTCFLIPIVFWMFVKPLLSTAKQFLHLSNQLHHFKFHPYLFKQALLREPETILLSDAHTIIFGNPDAATVLTVVSNPYCQPCADIHKMVDSWVHLRESVKIQLVFATLKNEDDPSHRVAAHLLSMKLSGNDDAVGDALRNWYEHRDFAEWSVKYPVLKNTEIHDVVNGHNDWCVKANIKSTPVMFINGRRLPDLYQPIDIKYLL